MPEAKSSKSGKSEPVTPGVRHERSDVSFRGLLAVTAVLGIAALLVYVVVSAIFVVRVWPEIEGRTGRALSSAQPGPLPEEPRLEGLGMPERHLATPPDSYGPVPGRTGVVRIPVERAMDILAGKLPARPRAPEETIPRDSNSGRTRKAAP